MIDRNTWEQLLEISDSPEWLKSVILLANKYYCISPQYDDADQRFNDVIRPLLGRYELDDCIQLIEGIQDNGQTWERRSAYTDHREVRARALDIDSTFDPTIYEVFNRRLG